MTLNVQNYCTPKLPEQVNDNKTNQLNQNSNHAVLNKNRNLNSDAYINSATTTDKCNDGKITFKEGAKSFLKGVISPLTSMLKSPKNFLIGAGMMIGGVTFIMATGGAAAPVLVAAGVVGGGIQVVKGVIGAATAKTDNEAKQAFENIGAGTGAVAMSVAGAKASLKSAGISTEGLNPIAATAKCFTTAPKNISTSIRAFTQGKVLTNIKSALGIKQKTAKPIKEAETANKPIVKKPETEPKAEVKSEINAKSEVEQTAIEIKPEVKAGLEPEIKAEVKTEQPKVEPKIENGTPKESCKAPEIEIQAKNNTAEQAGVKPTAVKQVETQTQIKESVPEAKTSRIADKELTFTRGRAYKNGKEWSGTTKITKNNGDVVKVQYKDGNLISADTYNAGGELIQEKKIWYSEGATCESKTIEVTGKDLHTTQIRKRFNFSSLGEDTFVDTYLPDGTEKLVSIKAGGNVSKKTINPGDTYFNALSGETFDVSTGLGGRKTTAYTTQQRADGKYETIGIELDVTPIKKSSSWICSSDDPTNSSFRSLQYKKVKPKEKLEALRVQQEIQFEELAKCPENPKEGYLYRGVKIKKTLSDEARQFRNVLLNSKKGDIICPDWCTTCTTSDPKIAITYGDTLLRIKTPKGSRFLGKGGSGIGTEINLPLKAEYRYVGNTKVGEFNIVDLEYIMPDLSKYMK